MSTVPAHLTDPDEIDAWLEARDVTTREDDAGALDETDTAVARLRSGARKATGPNPEILARRKYAELPFWRRWFTEEPPGYRPDTSGLVIM